MSIGLRYRIGIVQELRAKWTLDMLSAMGLKVDESLLTGESAAVPKRPGEKARGLPL